MKITRTSMISKKVRTLDLPVTQEQIDSYYQGGLLLQQAFPNLEGPSREFIKSGITAEEWVETFGGGKAQ